MSLVVQVTVFQLCYFDNPSIITSITIQNEKVVQHVVQQAVCGCRPSYQGKKVVLNEKLKRL
jgi:hypothetical protein